MDKIVKGNHVYWKQFTGTFVHTISGIVESIKGDTATIVQTTQNSYGKRVNRKLTNITKSKKQ